MGKNQRLRKIKREIEKMPPEFKKLGLIGLRLDVEDLKFCPFHFSPGTRLILGEDEFNAYIDSQMAWARGQEFGDAWCGIIEGIAEDSVRDRKQREKAMMIIKGASTPFAPRSQILLAKLLEMSVKNFELAPDRSAFLSVKSRVQAIGEKLLELGSESLMLSCAEFVPKYDQRELDYCWNGIGRWRS